jgi:hypothetical protein
MARVVLGAGPGWVLGSVREDHRVVLTAGDPLRQPACRTHRVALPAVFLGLRQRAGEVISQSDPGNTSPSCPSVNLTR